MMKHKLSMLIAILIIIVFVLSGCKGGLKGGDGSDDDASNRMAGENFRQGSKAITMEWLKQDMPDVIYDTLDENEIQLLAQIRNEGAEDATVYLHLGGFDPEYIKLPTRFDPIELQGRSLRNAEGGLKILETPGGEDDPDSCRGPCDGTIKLPSGVDTYKPNFQLTACYHYKTVAAPMICVDPQPYKLTQAEKACNAQEVDNLGSSQGGPVSVSGVDVENTPSKVIFRIKLSTSDSNGKVFESQTPNDNMHYETGCPSNLRYTDMNVVHYALKFQGKSSDDGTIDCDPVQKVKLINGNGVIFCTTDNPSGTSAFQTPLVIELEYGYMNWIEEKIEIRRLIPE